jgi:uncharacterized protein (DUF302 family)
VTADATEPAPDAVLAVLTEGRNNAANVAAALDCTETAAEQALSTLVEDGRVCHVGNGVYEHAAPSRTVESAMETTVPGPFEDAVLRVQIEHEVAGFETVATTRLDKLVEVVLEESVERTALVVVCHPEIARDAVEIDPTLGGLLPCTTVVYERPDDDAIYARHYSATKAIEDLGAGPPGSEDAIEDLVILTGDRMARVWEGIETL